MRFELFLTTLPKASLKKVQEQLADLPKGTSSGAILKSLEARRVPTVPVAWSDDKRVINEVMDTLLELGAECKVLDHGGLVQKLATLIEERLGASRYRDDEDEDRTLIKLGGDHDETAGAAFARHVLTYFLQLCLVATLFGWYVALQVGWQRLGSAAGLVPELGACALGLLAVYASTACVRALRASRIDAKLASAVLVVSAGCTVAALFFLGDRAGAAGGGAVKRPPSNPYSGLLVELRRRKLAAELEGRARDAEGAIDQQESALSCELPAGWGAPIAECAAGPAWDEALACLPAPQLPVRAEPSEPPHAIEAAVAPAPVERPAPVPGAHGAGKRSWRVTFELVDLLGLMAVCWLSLLGVYVRERIAKARAAAAAAPSAPPAPALPDLSISEVTPTRLMPHPELQALREELAQARAALGEQPEQAPEQPPPEPENTQLVATLQRELTLTRSALGANQSIVAQLKQQIEAAGRTQGALTDEVARLQRELAQAMQELDQARAASAEAAARLGGGHEPANDAQAPAKAPGRAGEEPAGRATLTGDHWSYSVTDVQEDRVIPKRRR
jgi:hypothetical protein